MVLERFEGECAVIETDDGRITVSRECVECSVCEGDVLFEQRGIFYTDICATQLRKEAILLKIRCIRDKY